MLLRARVEKIFAIAEKRVKEDALPEESGRQDKSMEDCLLADGAGRLKGLKDKLTRLPLEQYDEPLACRIHLMDNLGKHYSRNAGACTVAL
mmetsp:Transcript_34141/g.74961  ORF Transcript_34141/g.74961 Transcript_34141/m.74961 type:complete len:91 (+) Transcript_34141:540-812(+)|eukprot:6174950-Pleurochrysis_carterae.AAC.3